MNPNDHSQLQSLFLGAQSSGLISAQTRSMLTGHLGDVVIAGAAGTALEDIVAADVTLVTVLIDASSSIAYGGLEQAVRDGHAALLDAFGGSKEADSILVATWTFDSRHRALHSYVPVDQATRLDASNYAGTGATVLYDAWCDGLAANVAYAQQLRDGGTPCRSVAVVITDGEDTSSRRSRNDCARLSADLLRSEQFVLGFVGVGDAVDFRRIAQQMGVPDGSVLVQRDASPAALRQTFQMVSRSALRVSQGRVRPGGQLGFFGP
jgi:hypothetical protein